MSDNIVTTDLDTKEEGFRHASDGFLFSIQEVKQYILFKSNLSTCP